MPLARLDAPFEHPDWIFEPKMDGFRAVAYVEGGACRLVSRNPNAFKTFKFRRAASWQSRNVAVTVKLSVHAPNTIAVGLLPIPSTPRSFATAAGNGENAIPIIRRPTGKPTRRSWSVIASCSGGGIRSAGSSFL
jgi:hypothetical protein